MPEIRKPAKPRPAPSTATRAERLLEWYRRQLALQGIK